MNEELYKAGLAVRSAVLGEEYVAASAANVDGVGQDFQRLVTEYCWGAVWGRDTLPRATRSIVNIAMICALNRPQELKLHVQGALRNGVSRDEIREVLMQVAIYAGVPAGVDGFRVAAEAFNELDDAKTAAK